MERIAVFPGSFDPFTIGHESIARRALPIFDKIIIAVGQNITKGSFLPLENRMDWIREIFADEPRIEVQFFKGLTVDFCKKVNAKYIIRGLRTAADFEYERAAGQVNKALEKNIESVFLLTNPEYSFINSTIVRDIIRNGGDAKIFLPHSKKMSEFLKTFKIQ
jgi:pantetheine-phosphate adenylyltransferase